MKNLNSLKWQRVLCVLLAIASLNCSKKGSSTASSATNAPMGTVPTISWAANHEAAVNRAGGGYKVYYSNQSGFNIATASSINVPYVSGAQAPSSLVLSSLPSGTYYLVVVAYSSLNPPGGNSGSVSGASAQTSITIP